MNHVYRLVWSKSRKALVAVSELTSSKRHGASSGIVRVGKPARLLSLVLIGAGGFVYAAGAHAQSTGDVKLDNLQSLVNKYGAPVQALVGADGQGVGAPTGAPVSRVLSAATEAASGLPVVGSVASNVGKVVDTVAAAVSAGVAPDGSATNGAPVSSRARVLGIADSSPVSSLPVVGPVVAKVGDVLGSATSGTGNPGGAVRGVVGGVVDTASKLPVAGPVVAKVGDVLGSATPGAGNPGGAIHGVVDGVIGTASKLPVAGPVVAKVGDLLGSATSGTGNPGGAIHGVVGGVIDTASKLPVAGPVVAKVGDLLGSATSGTGNPGGAIHGVVDGVVDTASKLPVAGPVVAKVGDVLGSATSGAGNPGGAIHGIVDGVVDTASKLPVAGPVVAKVGDLLGSATSGTGNPGGAIHGVVGGVIGTASKLPLAGPVVAKVGDVLGSATPGGDGSGSVDLGGTLGKVVGGVVNTAATLPVAGPTVASAGEALKTATSGGNIGGGLEGQAGQVVGHLIGSLARTPGIGQVVAGAGTSLEETTAEIGQGNGGAGGASGLLDGVVDATSKVPVVGPVVAKVGDVVESVTSSTGNPGGAVNGVVDRLVDATSKVPVVGPVVAAVGDVVGSATSGTGNAGGVVNGVIGGLVGATSQLPVLGPVVGQVGQTLASVTSGVGGLGQASAAAPAALSAGMAPMAVPVVPPAASAPSGLVVSNGGTVGNISQLLGTTENGLFNHSDPNGYVTNGGLQVSNANFTQGYSTLSLLGLPLLNTTPVGTLLTTVDGAVLGGTGANSHLTLVGAVNSGNYISNINNGAAGGLAGLVLPSGAPAWASSCLNVAGLLTESCWAVNAAQDRQVLMGDGASANGSNEVVIGTGASHTLPTVDACTAFPGSGRNDANNPCGVPTADYATRLGHSVVIGDDASGSADGQTVLGAGASASAANSVALGHQSAADRGAQSGYTAYGLATPQNSAGEVSVGSPGQERQITNVAAGSADTDAVNVAQLRSVQSTADNSVQYDDPGKAVVTLAGTASTDGGKTDGTTISNLHQGTLGADSTDAVNGAQLWEWTQDTNNVYSNYSLYNSIKNLPGPGTGSTKYFSVNSTLGNSNASGENAIAIGPEANASGANSAAMGNGATASADDSVALGAGSVADRADTVSVGSSGHERQIANVAAGTETTDAANVGQVQQAVNWANAYTDQRFNLFNQQLDRIGRNANAGIAGAMAMAGLPQAYLPGKSMAAVAAGTFRGESSLAIGISTISEGGRWVYKLTGSTNTRGDAGVTIGAGLQW